MSELHQRAQAAASKHTPASVAKAVGIFLENFFLGTIACIGWTLGRAWFLIFCVILAFMDGIKQGAKVDELRVPPRGVIEGHPSVPGHQGEPGPANTYVYSEPA